MLGVVLVALSILVTILIALVVVNLSVGERRVEQEVEHLYSLDDPQFFRSMGLLLGPEITHGNRIKELVNGDQIFPEMLEAIRGAQRTVLFETFIYWSGDIGTQLAQAMAERARAGVKVHVLLDWLGSLRVDPEVPKLLSEAGVEVRLFHPLHWYHLGRMNNRTHRKLLIVDGRIGFTGGVGIAPQWTGNAQDPEHWRDSHFRVEGPVVAQMQSVMLSNWSKTTGCILHGEDYFPALEPVGDQPAQMFASSPSGGSESMTLMVHLAITAAVRTIDIGSAYFVPDAISCKAICAALKRGVRVRVITPGKHTDEATVRRASRGLWGDLLEHGLEMYEYQPTMFHVKVMIVDGILTSVGSTNFDPRSLHLNDEANLNVYDREFAARMTALFEADLRLCHRITLAEWQHRPVREKVHERLATLLAPVL
ncbi:phospholipase D-like domain-containing protein [Ramlibacter rhizophilus]|uniref:Cardiolipin synthase B n=1 Tax=Ramlibacter rhizophilus TaxID=1781167 RepID=A0A4Z0BK27_9BURK|nr:phospholipase D-like domain-containing protein [Ramlibacter rhizophilus]TFY98773.1 cardiolipin synthase B [Ramlibacter rhizophilus]